MKKFLKSRVLVLVVLACMVVATTRCGYILYPERRGHTAGRVDPAVLVMDCLWLIVFIVPGVVALVVDFAAGGMYEGGGGHKAKGKALNVHPGDKMAFNLRGRAPADAEVRVTLGGVAGRDGVMTLLDKKCAAGEESGEATILSIPANIAPGAYKLAVRVNGIESASMGVNVAP